MRICIAIPMLEGLEGHAVGHQFSSVVEVSRSGHEFFTCNPVGLFPHDRARFEITKEAIARDCDRIWWIDADTIAPRGSFARLMQTMDETGAIAVSGHYVRRGWPYTPVWSAIDPLGNPAQVDASEGVHELISSGLGCCLVDLHWCVKNLPKTGWYLQRQNKDFTEVTDDLTFFELIRNHGGKLLGDAEVVCSHLGSPEWINRDTCDEYRKLHARLEGLYEASKVRDGSFEPVGGAK